MKKALGYVRVSTKDQEGLSPEVQEQKIRDYCAGKGWEVAGVIHDDGKSGKSLNRPGVKRLIEACKRKGTCDVVVVVKLDRLTRDIYDLLKLTREVFQKHGVSLVSLTEAFDGTTASGQLMLTMLGGFAQFFRQSTGERIKDSMEHLRKQGRRLGGDVPYGYRAVPKEGGEGKTSRDNPVAFLQPVDQEQYVICLMRELRKQDRSYQEIADTLTSGGYVPRGGGKWHPMAVHRAINAKRTA